MKPGSDMSNGCARSVTLAGPNVNRWITLRRVASDRAQNT